jgi:uncharacterized protein YkuJ
MEKSKNKLSLYLSLVLLVVVLGIFFGARYLKKRKWEKIEKYGTATIGILYDTGGNQFRFKYKVGNKDYSIGRSEPYNYLQNGEEYEVRYLLDEPDYAVIYFDRPVISDQYVYRETECTSIAKKISSIRYEYEVNGTIITRIKFYHEGESLTPDSYTVKYRQENPEIGYLIRKE